MHYLKRILLSSLLLFSIVVYGQNTDVQFRITNNKKDAVALATIRIVARDSSVLEKITDSAGVTMFNLKQGGMYEVFVSAVGYQEIQKNIIVKKEDPVYAILLVPVSKSLEAVVIKSKKPLLRQEDDKTIVDAESYRGLAERKVRQGITEATEFIHYGPVHEYILKLKENDYILERINDNKATLLIYVIVDAKNDDN